jgi:uncharacterized protein YndB with AHSA1/START domain
LTAASSGEAEAEREIVVSRTIDGPRRLVFEVYTDPKHLDQWWGPNGFSTRTNLFEFRRGGVWEFVMRAPDGTDSSEWIQWREIVPPERIVLVHGARADDPDAFESTITFVERGDERTEVTMRSLFKTKAQRDMVIEQYHAIEAGQQTLGRLADYITAHKKPKGG